MTFTHTGQGNPSLDFTNILGPDGYVSCKTILAALNAPCLTSQCQFPLLLSFEPHTQQWVIEGPNPGHVTLNHDLYQALADMAREQEAR